MLEAASRIDWASGGRWWKVTACASPSALANGVNQGTIRASTGRPCQLQFRISCAALQGVSVGSAVAWRSAYHVTVDFAADRESMH
jgi:hypothetical protein